MGKLDKSEKLILVIFLIFMLLVILNKCKSEGIEKDNSSELILQLRVDSLLMENAKLKDILISKDFGHEYTGEQRGSFYGEDQIEGLRKSDLDHIYQTKGRYRTTSDEVFDQKVQDYVDENIDEIVDKHRD